MLFLCSGSIIHGQGDEPDIRKIGGLFKALPFTTTSLIIGSPNRLLHKDLIIETDNTSENNA